MIKYVPNINGLPIALATYKQIGDFVKEKLSEQGYRCVLKIEKACLYTEESYTEEYCIYNDGEGGHCAAGWLVKNFKEDKGDCNNSWEEIAKKNNISLREVNFISELQSVHDCSGHWDKYGFSESGKQKIDAVVEHYAAYNIV